MHVAGSDGSDDERRCFDCAKALKVAKAKQAEGYDVRVTRYYLGEREHIGWSSGLKTVKVSVLSERVALTDAPVALPTTCTPAPQAACAAC